MNILLVRVLKEIVPTVRELLHCPTGINDYTRGKMINATVKELKRMLMVELNVGYGKTTNLRN